jgi:hypothetical protein
MQVANDTTPVVPAVVEGDLSPDGRVILYVIKGTASISPFLSLF